MTAPTPPPPPADVRDVIAAICSVTIFCSNEYDRELYDFEAENIIAALHAAGFTIRPEAGWTPANGESWAPTFTTCGWGDPMTGAAPDTGPIPVSANPTVPIGEAWIMQGGKLVGKITGLAAPDTGEEEG